MAYNELGGDIANKTINKNVQFFVFNDRLKDVRKFDVTNIDKVLLPQSQDNFTVYLAANNGNFNITITASRSMLGMVSNIAAVAVAIALAFAF